MADWWEADPEERYWLEITARDDIGADLHAPVSNESSRSFWSYDLVARPAPGDIVYHYDRKRREIVGYSEVVGQPWMDRIIWAAQGASARRQGIAPHSREGVFRGLGGFSPLKTPVTKAMLVQRRTALFEVRDSLTTPGKPSNFPFIPYGKHEVRALQGYLTKLPKALFAVLPELREGEATDRPSSSSQKALELGVSYRPANEALAVGVRDPFVVDPALVERALRGHAQTQNLLADFVRSRGGTPLSPMPGGPNYDLAWEQDDETWVAEVKSCSPSNIENQLRLGLGQVLRYRAILATRLQRPVRAMLAIEMEPQDPTWKVLCTDLGVELRWPATLQ